MSTQAERKNWKRQCTEAFPDGPTHYEAVVAIKELLQDVAVIEFELTEAVASKHSAMNERDAAERVADRQRSRAKDAESELQRVKQERDAFQRALLDAWSEWSETTITELPTESLAGVLRGALRRASEVIRERDAVAVRAAALYQFVNYVVTRSGSIAEMTDRAQVLADEGPAEIGERIIAERDMLRSQVSEEQWKELQAARAEIARKDRACQEIAVRANDEINLARANAAVMRESLLWYQRGDYGIICRCEGAKMCELHKAYKATEGDAGRVLLAEVSRLREENAALKTTMEDEQAGRHTEVLHLVEQLAAAKVALGRAHAALTDIASANRLHGCSPDIAYQSASTESLIIAERLLLLDPEGKAAAKYVAALESEHEAVAELDQHEALACLVDPPCGGCDACTARIAHAAVEALRGKGGE